ncbi:FAD-binding protein [Candidatus Saccharibacteria bacterium]|nr:FAD-binding protein [Candidatus Saccharibacteria bacterium]
MRINENILISSLTTMRLGGPAKFVVEIEKPEEIPEAYNFARQNNLPIFILGYGANTIGHDEGFPGVIIINRIRGIVEDFPRTGDAAGGTPSARSAASTMGETAAARPVRIKVFGGESWDAVVEYACEKGLTGIEALSKIPGLAAAAPVQNIGAYGQEIADTLVEIDVFDSVTNTFKTLKKADLNFSYRKSILNTTEKNRYFVISITLELHKGSMSRPFYNSIEKYITENNVTDFSPKGIREIVSKIRADKLPDPKYIPSAGSFFKNIYLTDEEADKAENKGYPVYRGKDGNKINSGWLIEQAGFKGKLLHGIRVNEKATLVLINESAKSYEDLSKARAEIVAKVYDKFGYWLEQEPMEIK